MRIEEVPYNTGHCMQMLSDGTFLISVGSFDNQIIHELSDVQGKIIRINPDGSVPKDNPFYDAQAPSTKKGLIYTLGTRKVAGITELPASHPTLAHSVYSVEPGEYSGDEINVLSAASDYGARRISGYCQDRTDSYTCPRATLDQVPSSVAYYGSAAITEWNNRLLVGTLRGHGLVVADLTSDGHIANIDATKDANSVMTLDAEHLIPVDQVTGDERITAVAVDAMGRVFLALTHYGEGLQRSGSIVRLENPLANPTGVLEQQSHSAFRLAPNPFSDHITISLDQPTPSACQVNLINMMGQTVAFTKATKGATQIEFPVASLPAGAYLIAIEINGVVSFAVVTHL
jgi:glucose/arabinose dehydrogenase